MDKSLNDETGGQDGSSPKSAGAALSAGSKAVKPVMKGPDGAGGSQDENREMGTDAVQRHMTLKALLNRSIAALQNILRAHNNENHAEDHLADRVTVTLQRMLEDCDKIPAVILVHNPAQGQGSQFCFSVSDGNSTAATHTGGTSIVLSKARLQLHLMRLWMEALQRTLRAMDIDGSTVESASPSAITAGKLSRELSVLVDKADRFLVSAQSDSNGQVPFRRLGHFQWVRGEDCPVAAITENAPVVTLADEPMTAASVEDDVVVAPLPLPTVPVAASTEPPKDTPPRKALALKRAVFLPKRATAEKSPRASTPPSAFVKMKGKPDGAGRKEVDDKPVQQAARGRGDAMVKKEGGGHCTRVTRSKSVQNPPVRAKRSALLARRGNAARGSAPRISADVIQIPSDSSSSSDEHSTTDELDTDDTETDDDIMISDDDGQVQPTGRNLRNKKTAHRFIGKKSLRERPERHTARKE